MRRLAGGYRVKWAKDSWVDGLPGSGAMLRRLADVVWRHVERPMKFL